MARFGIRVRVEGIKVSKVNIAKLKKLAHRGIVECTAKSAIKVQNAARQSSAVDTGRLRSSIRINFTDNGAGADVGSDVEYASFIEHGTMPHFPPVDALRKWARRVLRDEGAAFLVARAISRRGTKPRPFLQPAWDGERRNYVQCVKREIRTALRKSDLKTRIRIF